MLTALRTPGLRQWPATIRRSLYAAFSDFTLREGRIYYRDRLFVPDADEVRT